MSDTNARILKLWKLGLTVEKIAKRIGRPGDYERIREAVPNRGVCQL